MTELRADAQQNRAAIVRAAVAALEESGDASLNAIAKRAGVGIGTLYRHFPTREDLMVEVYRTEVQQLVDLAPALLGKHAPAKALRAWLDRLAEYGNAKAGLASVFAAATHERLNAETYGPIVGALDALLAANKRAGTVRKQASADELLLLLGFLWRIDPASDWRAQAKRGLDIVVDGLRPPTAVR